MVAKAWGDSSPGKPLTLIPLSIKLLKKADGPQINADEHR
jgi:hypothetical protein